MPKKVGGSNDHVEKGIVAIGFALFIWYISQNVTLLNCHGCTACPPTTIFGIPIGPSLDAQCQSAYWSCVANAGGCAQYSSLVSTALFTFAVLLFIYGVVRIVW